MVAADGLGAGPTWAKDRGTDWAAMGGDGLLVDGSVQVYSILPLWCARVRLCNKVDEFVLHTEHVNLKVVGTDWAAMGGDGLLVDGSVQVTFPFSLSLSAFFHFLSLSLSLVLSVSVSVSVSLLLSLSRSLCLSLSLLTTYWSESTSSSS